MMRGPAHPGGASVVSGTPIPDESGKSPCVRPENPASLIFRPLGQKPAQQAGTREELIPMMTSRIFDEPHTGVLLAYTAAC